LQDQATTPPMAESFARWAVDVQLDEQVLQRAQDLLLDVVGVAVGGSASAVAERVRERLRIHSRGDDLVIGSDTRLATPAAAFANGVAAHSLELDDGYTRGSVHPSAVVAPAVLATVSARGGTVAELARAYAVGAEVTCRVAEAGHPATYWRGFHNTSLAGVIGGAAGCAVARGLDRSRTAHAIGLACSHSGGTFEFAEDGADSKRLHPGIAARDAWQCADFAEGGITAPTHALEGRRGYFMAFAGEVEDVAQRALGGLGDHWRLTDIYTKPHACCRALHASVDALLELRSEHDLDWQQVDRVTITTYRKAAEYCRTEVDTLLDAQMSMPVAAVVALRRGGVSLADLAWAVEQGELSDDLRRVEVRVSDEFNELYPPLRPNHVAVQLRDGRRVERYVDQPYGEPGNPMSQADLHVKFRGLVEPVLGGARAQELMDTLADPEQPAQRVLQCASTADQGQL